MSLEDGLKSPWELTLEEALEVCEKEGKPLCFNLSADGEQRIILVATGEEAVALFEFVKSSRTPPTQRN